VAQPRHDVRLRMSAQLDHDPAPAHFVRHRAGGAAAGEGVEHEVAGVGGEFEHTLNQRLRLLTVGKIHPPFVVKVVRQKVIPKVSEGRHCSHYTVDDAS